MMSSAVSRAKGASDGGASESTGATQAGTNGESHTAAQLVSKLAVAAVCGAIFGTAIHKSGVFSVEVLRDQFNFTNETMLKTFLSATGTSITTLSLMRLVPSWRDRVERAGASYRNSPVGLPMTIVGAMLLGVGMTVGGACPGTIWIQLGSGSVKSLYTMAGAITAAGLHGVLYDKYLKGVTAAGLVPKAKASVADLSSDHTGKAIVGLGVAGALVGMLMSVERLSGSGMPFLPRSLAQTRWHPVLCGMMIGSLQLPLTLALSKNVGSASTMQTLSSLLFWKTDRFPKLNAMKRGLKNWWQVTYLFAACATSAAITVACREPWYTGGDLTSGAAFAGGFLILSGARLAGGCTSGHGISGAGHQMWRSFAAVAAMFAGAIGARYVLG